MDAAPPPAIYCEAPVQDVLLRVSGRPDERNFSAFLIDARSQVGVWTVESNAVEDGSQTIVLRARPQVSYKAVTDATLNAQLRNFSARVTFDAPRCPTASDQSQATFPT